MRLGYVIALLAALLLVVGCVPEEVEPEPAPVEPEPVEEVEEGPGDMVEVVIDGKMIDPESVTIAVGGTVTWKKADNLNHQIKDLDGLFNSAQQLYGESTTFEYTYMEAGTYTYRDTYGTMGTVVVE